MSFDSVNMTLLQFFTKSNDKSSVCDRNCQFLVNNNDEEPDNVQHRQLPIKLKTETNEDKII